MSAPAASPPRSRRFGSMRCADWHVTRTDADPIGTARAHTRETLRWWGIADPDRDVALVVSELVTNALQHTVGEVAFGLRADAAGLLVWVWDTDPMRTPPDPDRHPSTPRGQDVPSGRDLDTQDRDDQGPGVDEELGEHGRGLLLVAALATDSGCRVHPEGKTVWARLPLALHSAAPALAPAA